jgi:exopolysaccharide biosynthesis polyprenyl glycosylphosphotransferase
MRNSRGDRPSARVAPILREVIKVTVSGDRRTTLLRSSRRGTNTGGGDDKEGESLSELTNGPPVLMDTRVIDLDALEWTPSRRGDPGFVGHRLLTASAVLLVAEWLLVVAMFVVVSRLRFGVEWTHVWDRTLPGWSALIPLHVTAASAIALVADHYEIRPTDSWPLDLKRAIRGVSVFAIASLAMLFLFDRDDVSRMFLIAFFGTVFVGMVAIRGTARVWFRHRRATGKGIVNVLVVGSGPVAEGFTSEATAHAEAGLNVIGFLDAPGRSLLDYNRLGSVDDLPVVLEHLVVDEVVVCLPLDSWTRIGSIAQMVEQQGKAVRIPVQLPGTINSRSRLDHLAGVPVLSLVSAPDQPLATACKRLVDQLVAAIALVVLAPLGALIASSIFLSDGRPILFAQPRVGLNGRTFTLWKFRTMVVDAERRREEVAELNEREGPVFKASRDPRVTPLGRVLRAASLDELPQLWNVLKGDMSLVGPRPALHAEVEQYDPWHRRRLSMKPGMTGLWQVSIRNDKRFDSWVARDLEYIDSWSLVKDLKILFRTVPAVLRLTGR